MRKLKDPDKEAELAAQVEKLERELAEAKRGRSSPAQLERGPEEERGKNQDGGQKWARRVHASTFRASQVGLKRGGTQLDQVKQNV